MDYVCDTNVWYDIGSGLIDPKKLKQGNNRLLAPAINAIELSSNINGKNFVTRQLASKAVLDHADLHLEDPERVMGEIWRLGVPPLQIDWRDVYRTIAASKDVAEISNGTQSILKVDTAAAKVWRDGFSAQFVADVESAIRVFVPKYALRRKRGQMDYLTGVADILKFKTALYSADVSVSQILLTRSRAAQHLSSAPNAPSQTDIDTASPQLFPFVQAYLKFIEKVATTQSAFPNDWGDLHCFIYLQGGRQLLTGENKWLSIAKEAGLDKLVQDSKLL